ncbi:MAG: hypothetical protein NC225_04325 [Clostridium sp.]|nr:hypothetical protein [Clostridium sp.]MCM1458678.1 hypothetical protein [Bacteroides sp.]
MGKYKVCNYCHIAFDKNFKYCPSCRRRIEDESPKTNLGFENEGRRHHVGGEACDYCPHCYGTADWCPFDD